MKDNKEWLGQAEYDMETAKYMFEGGRYFYAVFMCHLAIEKGLKGLFISKTNHIPEKTHNLVYLMNQISLTPPEEIGRFIVKLSEASIPTRYPESLAEIEKNFNKEKTHEIIHNSKKALAWIKKQF